MFDLPYTVPLRCYGFFLVLWFFMQPMAVNLEYEKSHLSLLSNSGVNALIIDTQNVQAHNVLSLTSEELSKVPVCVLFGLNWSFKSYFEIHSRHLQYMVTCVSYNSLAVYRKLVNLFMNCTGLDIFLT